MRQKILFLTVLFSFTLSTPVRAHPGRTDAYGCHTCRTNCAKWGLSTGEYHCHNAKALPQPQEPVKSHYSESGGSTTPAPEYKQPKAVVKPQPTKVAPIPTVTPATKPEPIKAEVKDSLTPEPIKLQEVKKKTFWESLWEALTK